MMCYVYEHDIQALLVLFLPFMAISRLADHYCHWFSELSLSRINKSTTSYTFTPYVGSFTTPGLDTRYKGPPAVSVSSERHGQCKGNEIVKVSKRRVG